MLMLGIIGSVFFMILGVPIICTYWFTTHCLSNCTSNLHKPLNLLIFIFGVILSFIVGLVLNFVVIPVAFVLALPVLLVMFVYDKCIVRRRMMREDRYRRILEGRVDIQV
jgi:membrane protein YdbS with pleckstrin-like domain